MKAKHRHELKTNELAEWLANLPLWAKQNLRMIIYASVVAVLVLGSFIYHRYQKTVISARERTTLTALLGQLPPQKAEVARSQADGVDLSYMLLQVAGSIENIASRTKQDHVAALALIKNAELLRIELQFRTDKVSRQDLANQINRAKDNYTKALDTYLKKSPFASLEAAARLGLGLCEEELGNFDQARQLYEQLVADPNLEGTTGIAAANKRLDLMDSFEEKIALKPAPKLPETIQIPINPSSTGEEPLQLTIPEPNVTLPGLE